MGKVLSTHERKIVSSAVQKKKKMIVVMMILMVRINNVNKRYLNKKINKKINKPKSFVNINMSLLLALYFLGALKTLYNIAFSSLFCSYLSIFFKSTSNFVIAAT